MSECILPEEPGQGASREDWVEYFEDLAAYADCMADEAGGAYAGICDNISEMSSAALEVRTRLNLVTTPPSPLPLTPAGTLSGLISQIDSVAQDIAAQDLATQSGQQKAYQDCTWAMDWLKPASKSGTLANLAGC